MYFFKIHAVMTNMYVFLYVFLSLKKYKLYFNCFLKLFKI